MEQTIFQYPFYRSNQFLTSQDLNKSFLYLEEQERLTRSKMIGNGIISGLDTKFKCDPKGGLINISVNPGFGVTSDGYSIDVTKSVLYEYMVLYSDYVTDKDVLDSEKNLYNSIPGIKYLLFTADEIKSGNFIYNNSIVKSTKDIKLDYKNCCFALAVDVKLETSFNCNPSDCNINSSDNNIIYRPVLIDITKIGKTNSYFSGLNYLKIHKLHHISEINSLENYNLVSQTILHDNINIIELFLKKTLNSISGLLVDESASLLDALSIFNKSIINDFKLYYLSALNDIQAAANEFVSAYNNYINKYAFTSVSRIDKLLIIGTPFFLGPNDDYKYTYVGTSINEQFNADSKILSNLFLRIAKLMEDFMPYNVLSNYSTGLISSSYIETKLSNEIISDKLTPIPENVLTAKVIKIIPCKGYSEKLGNRSIPYYYKVVDNTGADTITQYWHAHDLDPSLDMVYNYYWYDLSIRLNYVNDFLLNLNDYPFYRIEGHHGLPVNQVYNYLNFLVSNLDIPVQILKIDITNQAWIGFKTNFDQLANKYNLFVTDVKGQISKSGSSNTLTSIAKNLDKLNQSFAETSYRDVTGVKKILDDVNAYCNLIISPDFITKTFKTIPKLKVKSKANSKAKLETVTVPINEYIKTELANQNIFDLRSTLAELYANATPISETALSQLKGLEYLAGVYKGGTFVLLYDGSQTQKPIIGDFALPYFYNLDKGRLL